ncbi:MAG: winged helix-turn-helix domain-containing protein [Pseudomonadota bacterium]
MPHDATEPFAKPATGARPFRLGAWLVDPDACSLAKDGLQVSLEPKVMDLLALLAGEPSRVFSRAEIEAALWSDVTVGEDTLARAVSKLRRALGDVPQAPNYIETIPKRGYRVIATVSSARPVAPLRYGRVAILCVGLVAILAASLTLFSTRQTPSVSEAAQLTSRADDFYMRFTRADNEAAIALYQRVIAADADYAPAQAGLANALVQRVVRWPNGLDGASTLGAAIDSGLTQTTDARNLLARATAMAERAARLSPNDPDALKALGFAYSAQGDLDRAEAIYRRAISIDRDAWAALINLGEIHLMKGDRRAATAVFEQAYSAMDRSYQEEPQRIGPWQAALGVVIGEGHEALGAPQEAEIWYRRVLVQTPFEPEATVRLAGLLKRAGDAAEADRLCAALTEKVGAFEGCDEN